jgi:hypothetical protein
MTDTLQAFVRDAEKVKAFREYWRTAVIDQPGVYTFVEMFEALVADREAQLAEKDATIATMHRDFIALERDFNEGGDSYAELQGSYILAVNQRDDLQSRLTQAEATLAAVRQLANGWASYENTGHFTPHGEVWDITRKACAKELSRALVGAAPTQARPACPGIEGNPDDMVDRTVRLHCEGCPACPGNTTTEGRHE